MSDVDARELGGRGAGAAVGPETPPAARTAVSPPAGALPSSDLLRGRSAVHIEHNGALYLLRATRLGKLILTK
jgi:hemin uptake protein HemP